MVPKNCRMCVINLFNWSLLLNTNLPFFTEAQCHNTCLNRKVCLDAEGNIKNCPAMAKSYGNIKDTSLEVGNRE